MVVYRIQSVKGVGPYKCLHTRETNSLPNGWRFAASTLKQIQAWFDYDSEGMSNRNPLGVAVYRVPRGHTKRNPNQTSRNLRLMNSELVFNPSKAQKVAWLPLEKLTHILDVPSKFRKKAI